MAQSCSVLTHEKCRGLHCIAETELLMDSGNDYILLLGDVGRGAESHSLMEDLLEGASFFQVRGLAQGPDTLFCSALVFIS